jgi:hypothetical protein
MTTERRTIGLPEFPFWEFYLAFWFGSRLASRLIEDWLYADNPGSQS